MGVVGLVRPPVVAGVDTSSIEAIEEEDTECISNPGSEDVVVSESRREVASASVSMGDVSSSLADGEDEILRDSNWDSGFSEGGADEGG